jgi:acylphosphatase
MRYWAITVANSLGLDGWVQNLPDGRVRIEVSGPEDAVNEFAARCQVGNDSGRPGNVSAADVATIPVFSATGFRVRHW